MKTSDAGCAFLFHWEVDPAERDAPIFHAYLDQIAQPPVWTIGVGHTDAAGPPAVTAGMTMTRQQVLETLSADLGRIEPAVNRIMGLVPQNVFDGAVSFEYNTGGLEVASWVRLYKGGFMAIAKEHFMMWDQAGGKVVPGLVNRRAAEWAVIASNNYQG